MELNSLLARTQLCAELTIEELERLAAIISVRRLAREEVLFLEGDPAQGFYLLLSGRVRLYKAGPDGREQTLHLVAAGQSFAEAAIFRGDRFPANCIALLDSQVAFVPKSQFLQILAESPTISLKMIGSLAGFLREFIQIIEGLALKEVSARLAGYLLNLQQQSDSTTLTLPMSKTELSRQLGTVSETISRNLRKLKELGLIEVEGRQIKVLDSVGLAEIAASREIDLS